MPSGEIFSGIRTFGREWCPFGGVFDVADGAIVVVKGSRMLSSDDEK